MNFNVLNLHDFVYISNKQLVVFFYEYSGLGVTERMQSLLQCCSTSNRNSTKLCQNQHLTTCKCKLLFNFNYQFYICCLYFYNLCLSFFRQLSQKWKTRDSNLPEDIDNRECVGDIDIVHLQ